MVLNILLNNLKIYLLWSFYFVTDNIAKKGNKGDVKLLGGRNVRYHLNCMILLYKIDLSGPGLNLL